MKISKNQVQALINQLSSSEIEQLTDQWHTFKELYEFRKLYNAALFNEWGNYNTVTYYPDESSFDGLRAHIGVRYRVHKSWKHNDGELCFGGGWFIVCAQLPSGQISNHYPEEDWDLFKIPEEEKALWAFDGHTSGDVIERLKDLITK